MSILDPLRRCWFRFKYGHEPPHRWGQLQREYLSFRGPVFYSGCMDCGVERSKVPVEEAPPPPAPKDPNFYHVGCGGKVWAYEYVTSIVGECDKCHKRWLFGPKWCAPAKEGA